MTQIVRVLLIVGGFAMLALSAIFCFNQELALKLWMWPDGPLSLYFVASMQAAIAAAMLWIGFSGELAALAPGALNLVVMMAGCALSFYLIDRRLTDQSLSLYTIGCGLFALFNVWLYWWARRIPLRDNRPLPGPVRTSYWLFVFVLAGVGIALFLMGNGVLPWKFSEQNAYTPLILGWMFFGDAFYFLYALIYPRWHNACAQLCSFLAYDLVLLGPLLIRWPIVQNVWAEAPKVAPGLESNLIIYSCVLIYSGALGVYYLLINPETRLFAREPVYATGIVGG
ncbi:MAG TPA: hypothetical protein PKE45_05290 [Caldilineaceae bacterium]|nr:hypothetical protein [Caldilineaceae bacterium]